MNNNPPKAEVRGSNPLGCATTPLISDRSTTKTGGFRAPPQEFIVRDGWGQSREAMVFPPPVGYFSGTRATKT